MLVDKRHLLGDENFVANNSKFLSHDIFIYRIARAWTKSARVLTARHAAVDSEAGVWQTAVVMQLNVPYWAYGSASV